MLNTYSLNPAYCGYVGIWSELEEVTYRAGQPWVSDYKPPSHLARASKRSGQRYWTAAVYQAPDMKPLTTACIDGLPFFPKEFYLVREKSGRMSVCYGEECHLIRWRKISQVEIDLLLTWG